MNKPTIVITGTPDWAESVSQQLADSYTVKQYTKRAPGYVAQLADDQPVMILVDGEDKEWRFWTTTPKVSPATRRIQVVVVARHPERRDEALIAGADNTLTPGEVKQSPLAYVKSFVPLLTPLIAEQLDCECQDDLPPLGKRGIEKFNAGEYYPQHDLFEEQWMNTEGPVRNLYQAILQVGIAYFQITRGNHRGALKMLLRSVQWLSMLPDECQGVDVRQLREDSSRVRAELERMNPADITHFDRTLLKPVRYTTKTG